MTSLVGLQHHLLNKLGTALSALLIMSIAAVSLKTYKYTADHHGGSSEHLGAQFGYQLGNVLTLPAPWFPHLKHGDNADDGMVMKFK